MAPGYCCVAGITESTHEHIRPVLGERLPIEIVRPFGGPFDMGAVVELGEARAVGRVPEIEDYLVWPDDLAHVGYVSRARVWELVRETASSSLEDIFSDQLKRSGDRMSRASVSPGQGKASLGCFAPSGEVRLHVREINGTANIRIELAEEGLDLSLTDARYYTDHYRRPHRQRIAAAQAAIGRGEGVVLGVGLTRPFAPSEEGPERHWLQVNALHL
jgi:hypothetical protein